MKRLKQYLKKKKFNQLKKELNISNDLAVPKVEKVIINMGIKDRGRDKNKLKQLKDQLSLISGQQPIERKAKQSISAFDVRENQIVGLMSTLRRSRAYDFIAKLSRIILPSWKNFKGIAKNSLTDQGNLTIGLPASVYFPEIDYEKVDLTNGLAVTIVTSADSKKKGLKLFEKLGFIFETEAARKLREESERKRAEERKILAERRKAYQEMAKTAADDELEQGSLTGREEEEK